MERLFWVFLLPFPFRFSAVRTDVNESRLRRAFLSSLVTQKSFERVWENQDALKLRNRVVMWSVVIAVNDWNSLPDHIALMKQTMACSLSFLQRLSCGLKLKMLVVASECDECGNG